MNDDVDLRYGCYVGKQILFVTNNASKSRKSYKTKFDNLGVEASVVGVSFGLGLGGFRGRFLIDVIRWVVG
jgi:hypothetical protein